MNNDINIVIKSQSQPDGGEGYSAGQAVRGNAYGEEGLSANMRGDCVRRSSKSEDVCTSSEVFRIHGIYSIAHSRLVRSHLL